MGYDIRHSLIIAIIYLLVSCTSIIKEFKKLVSIESVYIKIYVILPNRRPNTNMPVATILWMRLDLSNLNIINISIKLFLLHTPMFTHRPNIPINDIHETMSHEYIGTYNM